MLLPAYRAQRFLFAGVSLLVVNVMSLYSAHWNSELYVFVGIHWLLIFLSIVLISAFYLGRLESEFASPNVLILLFGISAVSSLISHLFFMNHYLAMIFFVAGKAGLVFLLLSPPRWKTLLIFLLFNSFVIIFFMPTIMLAVVTFYVSVLAFSSSRRSIKVAGFLVGAICVVSIFFKQEIRLITTGGGFEQIGLEETKFCIDKVWPLKPCVTKDVGVVLAYKSLINFDISQKVLQFADRLTPDPVKENHPCMSDDLESIWDFRDCYDATVSGHSSMTPGYRLEFVSAQGGLAMSLFCLITFTLVALGNVFPTSQVAKIISASFLLHISDFNNYTKDIIVGSVYLSLASIILFLSVRFMEEVLDD